MTFHYRTKYQMVLIVMKMLDGLVIRGHQLIIGLTGFDSEHEVCQKQGAGTL